MNQATYETRSKPRGLSANLRMGIILVALSLLLAPQVAAAHHSSSHTATQSYYSSSRISPNLYFDKGTVTNSKLIAYATLNYNDRYRLQVRAGSGTSTNDCTSFAGWLPNGTYYPNYYYYKNWGVSVVQGYVWELGSKLCSAGTVTRTGLFIHSNGIEGTAWDGNYTTEGCIKVSQLDRYSTSGHSLRILLRNAYNRDSEKLYVIS